MTMIKTSCLLVALAILIGGGRAAAQSTPATPTVLFVCERGAAKSVIAAAHFNQLAKERGLAYRAVARGTAPDAAIPAGVRNGLEAAGLELVVPNPVMVTTADASRANRIITFEIALPATVSAGSKSVMDWKAVPSVSADFTTASADIKRRVEALIDELARK